MTRTSISRSLFKILIDAGVLNWKIKSDAKGKLFNNLKRMGK